jgi:hypothetical protein
MARATCATPALLAAALLLPAPAPASVAGARSARAVRPAAQLIVRVSGNRLLDARGRTLRLVGVNRSGSQYMCVLGHGIFDGPVDSPSIAAISSWGVNAVRVPLNEDCWLGINGVPAAFSGAAYRSALEAYVARLNRQRIYVILDVHWNAAGLQPALGQQPMLDADHGYALWRSIAQSFRRRRGVLFDLYNEPHGLGATPAQEWDCWERGCDGFAGMSGLIATIRAAGAPNVILLAGLAWSADDSQWLSHEPRDPLHQLAAAFHVYRGHSACTSIGCWSSVVAPLAARVPVVDDEFGEMQCGEPAALAWLEQWMAFAQAHRLSLLAWSWNAKPGGCGQGPSLISDYDGTPTPYGQAVRNFYLEHRLVRR